MTKKDLDIKTIPAKALGMLGGLKKYSVFIFVIVIVLLYSFLVFRINGLTSYEPSDDEVLEKLQTVKRPRLDQAALEKIQELEDNSQEVRSLFQQTRENPFQE